MEDFRRKILPAWKIIPHTLFYKISYQKLLDVSRSGAGYDIIIACRMKDAENPGQNNVCSAAVEIRRKIGLHTIFVMSFNDLLATVKGMDTESEKFYLQKLAEYENDPGRESIGGIVRTSSTDPAFLISIVGDILEGPAKYLARDKIYPVETQAQFLNHPPGDTQIGIGQ
jgi:hypothetical protein